MRWITLVICLMSASLIFAENNDQQLRKRVVDAAQGFKGIPYVYGAASPPAFDCSGFVQYVYRQATSMEIPRNSKSQYAAGTPVAKNAMLPGDILVFDTVGGGGPSHVAIFLGDGSMIHAASAGQKTGVIVSRVEDSYFGPRFIGARSFLSTPNVAPPSAPPKPVPAATTPAAIPTSPPATSVQKPSASASSSETKAPVIPIAPAPAVAPPSGSGAKEPPKQPSSSQTPPSATQVKPASAKSTVPDEPVVAQIGFVIPSKSSKFTDKIPAETGTRIAFTLTNGTGKDGSFTAIFYKTAIDFSKSVEIHREFTKIPAGKALEIPPYRFTEPGKYKLIVKDNWNTQLMERIFEVVDVKR